jgi:hypothetical protein
MNKISRQEAKDAGLKRYYTGEPCPHGHIAERLISTRRCTECNRLDARKRYHADAEAARAYVRAWRKSSPERIAKEREKVNRYKEENKEALAQKQFEKYHADPEKYRARTRKWVKENREKHLAQRKAWRQKNIEAERERSRLWVLRNPHKNAADSAKQRAAKLRATPAWADKNELLVFYTLARDAEKMVPGDVKFHVDHIVPLRGKHVCGLHVPWNLQILEQSENCSKGNKFDVIDAARGRE